MLKFYSNGISPVLNSGDICLATGGGGVAYGRSCIHHHLARSLMTVPSKNSFFYFMFATFEVYSSHRYGHVNLCSLCSLLKVLRCASNDDAITLRAKHDTDTMEVFIENTDQDRTSSFEIKLMDIDQERLGIPVSHVTSCDPLLGSL